MHRCKRVAAAIGTVIGVDEAVLIVGLLLVAIGLWPVAGRVALVAPGAALVWISLPPRKAFVISTAPPEPRRRRSED